ncbi:MAG: tetratricopeptide repeat protein [Deltaproteobacteria bacterium]
MIISGNAAHIRIIMTLTAAVVMVLVTAGRFSAEANQFLKLARVTDYGKTYTEIGRSALQQGRYLHALRVLSTAIQKKGPAEAYKLRAQAYYHLHRYDKAMADVNRYVSGQPQDLTALILRGDLYNLGLDHDRALRDFEQAVKLAPASVAARLGEGIAFVGLEQYDRAVESFQKALELQPRNGDALVNLGVAYLLAGKSAKAREAFQTALAVGVAPDVQERVRVWMAQLH